LRIIAMTVKKSLNALHRVYVHGVRPMKFPPFPG
jgi:hypothetical protein